MKELLFIFYVLLLQIALIPLAILASMGMPKNIRPFRSRKNAQTLVHV